MVSYDEILLRSVYARILGIFFNCILNAEAKEVIGGWQDGSAGKVFLNLPT